MSLLADRVISVLVADDDADQRALTEGILHDAGGVGHDVTLVPDGREALRALREQVFDVAILDLSMPGLDGLEVFEAIGEDPQRPQVIFLSGYGPVATATTAMKLGGGSFSTGMNMRSAAMSPGGKPRLFISMIFGNGCAGSQ